MNPRINARERGLIKGAIRRVFSRSDLRQQVISESVMPGFKVMGRPKVKNWCKCQICGTPTPKSYMECDHIEPVIPLNSSLEEITWDELISRIWCKRNNLQAVCPLCHDEKTSQERKARNKFKKERQSNGK